MTLSRRAVAEAIGTMLLLAAVVGSGIMGDRLSGGNASITLLANSLATGAALVALILAFAGLSGAHFNPLVTLAAAYEGVFNRREVAAYIAAQFAGALIGVGAAHLMFGEAIFSASQHGRFGAAQLLSEFIATFGLLFVIRGCAHRQAQNPTAYAVGAYITGAYWFTASTSFANPAVTVARSLTNTFSGIRPFDVPAFIAAQLAGALVAVLLWSWLTPANRKVGDS